MTSFTSGLFTALIFLTVYWIYRGPSLLTSVYLDVSTDTRDGKLHSLNFLKEDVDHKFVQDKASILARLYFKFKYPHGRYVIKEEVLAHIFDQFFLSTTLTGQDIVIFVEPANGKSIESITPVMWKSVALEGTTVVPVTQRDALGDPLHWELYSAEKTPETDHSRGEAEDL